LKKAGPKFTDNIIENKIQIVEAIKKLIIIDFFDIFSSKDFAIAMPHNVAEIMNPKIFTKKTKHANPPKKYLNLLAGFFNGFSSFELATSGELPKIVW
jgi:hypothetical protein